MTFPGGTEAFGSAVAVGDQLECELGKRRQRVTLVPGPWDKLLSELAGSEVRLARVDERRARRDGRAADDRVFGLGRAGRARGQESSSLDSRRFRSLFELDGCRAHEEDEWQGRRLRAGEALIEVGEPVIRCAVTTRDPDTGERDVDMLGLIAGYRGRGDDGEIFFGALRARGRARASCRVGDRVEARLNV